MFLRQKKRLLAVCVAVFWVCAPNADAQVAVYTSPIYNIPQAIPSQQAVPNHGQYAQPYQYNNQYNDADGYYRPLQPQGQRVVSPNAQLYQQPYAVQQYRQVPNYYQAPQVAAPAEQYQDNDRGYYLQQQNNNYEDYYYDY